MDWLFNWLLEFLTEYRYEAIFGTLFLSGIGLPIPEEMTLLIAGCLVHKGLCDRNAIFVISFSGILLGDLAIYMFGRVYGMSILKIKYFSRFITRRRLRLAQVYVHRFGSKWIFLSRFVVGLRVAVYFSAGTMKMNVLRFLFWDFLGAVIMISVLVFAGEYFGDQIGKVFHFVEKAKFTILFFVLISTLAYGLYLYSTRKNGKITQKSR